MKTAMKPFNNQ